MRSEPQNIGLAFDVLTPKLSCLIRFGHLIFQTNVVQRVNSGRISLGETCIPVIVTPKLSSLIRFDHLIFQKNVFKRLNSGEISLVVTCTADYTCHHQKIPAKT